MFGTNVVGSGLSLTKVLGGISRGLSIANQVIPLYQQAKPMIQNARKVMSVLGDLKNPSNNIGNKTTMEVSEVKEKTEPIRVQSGSVPVFFQ